METLTHFINLALGIDVSRNLLASVGEDVAIALGRLALDGLGHLGRLLIVARAEGVLRARLNLQSRLRALSLLVQLLFVVLRLGVVRLLLRWGTLALWSRGGRSLAIALGFDPGLCGRLLGGGRDILLTLDGSRRWRSIAALESELHAGVAFGDGALGAYALLSNDLLVEALQALLALWPEARRVFARLLALAVLDHEPKKLLVGGSRLLALVHRLLKARPTLGTSAFLEVEGSANWVPVDLCSMSVHCTC